MLASPLKLQRHVDSLMKNVALSHKLKNVRKYHLLKVGDILYHEYVIRLLIAKKNTEQQTAAQYFNL